MHRFAPQRNINQMRFTLVVISKESEQRDSERKTSKYNHDVIHCSTEPNCGPFAGRNDYGK